jgi:hypothetical protein
MEPPDGDRHDADDRADSYRSSDPPELAPEGQHAVSDDHQRDQPN